MSDTKTLAIEGMTCDHCVAAVRKALATLEGVDEVVDLQLKPGRAIVKGSASIQALIAAVNSAGYQAREH